ncbi:MAG: hypothetical protein KC620_14200 [Myxococcales bacterium]|nr:hypothetical protein [Myxococcales bacterium]
MGLQINTNLSSLNAQRQQRTHDALLQKAFARLSSGLRINSAADDAAGLAISNRFTSQTRGLNQAIRNAGDGISLVQTAEGALSSVTENLQRIRELSIQAANGTLTDADRQAIQSEIDQLGEEIGRVSDTTTFNGKRLLDGSGGAQRFQVGANANETIRVGAIDARPQRLGADASLTGAQIDPSGLQAGELSINGVAIRPTQATDDTVSSAGNARSAIAVAAAINDASAATGVTAQVNATVVEGQAIGGGALDTNNTLTINGETISSVQVNPDDAGDGLIEAINAVSDRTGVTAVRNADGALTLTAEDGRNIDVQTTGNAAAITGIAAGTTTGTVSLSSEQQFTVAGADPLDAGFAPALAGVTGANAVSTIDVTTVDGANRALDIVDRALGQVSDTRSRLGALQNRFESTISNLANVSENVQAANSRIADADFAEEIANLVRERILNQANVSVLAQANSSQRSALALLGG